MRKLLACLTALAVALAGCGRTGGQAPPEPATPLAEPAANRMRCLYYERELFLGGMAAPRPYEVAGRLTAGLVPHHLLAADMIAGLFSLAARDPAGYDAVLILSPSHYPEDCGSAVVTSSLGWDTPYGAVEPAAVIVEALLADPAIAAEDNAGAMEADHGAAGLVPFARYYLPGVPVAACLLSNKLDREQLAALRRRVADICVGSRVLLVASMDCSHYQDPDTAALRDAETAKAIEDRDFRRILGFDDQNVDSPQVLTAFLEAADHRAATLEQLDHGSSAEKLPHALVNPIYAEGITTYFVYAAWS